MSRRGVGAVLFGIVLAASALASSAAGAETVTRPPVVEVTTWRAALAKARQSPARGPIVKGHSVGLFVNGSYCLGGPRPKFDHFTLTELPRTETRPYGAAVITAYRLWPEYSYTPSPGPSYGKCLPDRDRTIFHRVRTKRPAAELRLFDGYFSPPRQIWPPVRGGPRTLR